MNIDVESFSNLTVGEVLKKCKCNADNIRFIDEPPGKLRALKIVCNKNNIKQNVVLEIAYNNDLFSATRTWSFNLILKQKVIKAYNSDRFVF